MTFSGEIWRFSSGTTRRLMKTTFWVRIVVVSTGRGKKKTMAAAVCLPCSYNNLMSSLSLTHRPLGTTKPSKATFTATQIIIGILHRACRRYHTSVVSFQNSAPTDLWPILALPAIRRPGSTRISNSPGSLEQR